MSDPADRVWIDRLLERVLDRTASVAVVGQGYVGLTLASAAAEAGFGVVGLDVDSARVDALSRGEPAAPGVDQTRFAQAVASGLMTFSLDESCLAGADLVFICVPTPLHDHAPDLTYVEAATHTVSGRLGEGTLVVLESTTYPGTTEGLVQPILEAGSGLRAGVDFLLAYSPERVDPGNREFGMRNTPRVVGGTCPESLEVAMAFYGQLADKVVPVSTTRVAETAKLLENTFRHVNIALVNEMAILCHELGIDIWEVIEAASSKPFGFMPFQPGPGIGGHCIPLDPTYLAWQIRREAGRRFTLLEQAQDVNDRMPHYVAGRVGDILNERGRAVKGASVLVLGVAYKPDVGYVRESPALRTMQILQQRGACVSFHDFYVDEAPLDGEAIGCVPDLDAAVSEADLVVLLTPHSAYDLDAVAEKASVVFDTRNAYGLGRRSNVVPL